MPTTPTPSKTHQHVSYGGEDGGGSWCLHCPQMSVLSLGVCIAITTVPNNHGGEEGRNPWVSVSPLGVCLVLGTQGPLDFNQKCCTQAPVLGCAGSLRMVCLGQKRIGRPREIQTPDDNTDNQGQYKHPRTIQAAKYKTNTQGQMHKNAFLEWFQMNTNLLFWNGSKRSGKMCPSLMFPSFLKHLSLKMHLFTFSKFSVTYVPFISVTYVPFNQRKSIPKQHKPTLLEPFQNSTILYFWNRFWGSKLEGT